MHPRGLLQQSRRPSSARMVDTSMFASIQTRAPAWRWAAAGACLFGVSPPSWPYSRPLPCWSIFVATRRVTLQLARVMRLRPLMRHLLSHRNFEEAAYYKYCMKRPCLSGPYYTRWPYSFTQPNCASTCGGPTEDRSYAPVRKVRPYARAREKDTCTVLQTCSTVPTAVP